MKIFDNLEQVYQHYENLADEGQAKFDEIGIDNLLRIDRSQASQDDIELLEKRLGVKLHSSLKNILLTYSFARFSAFGTFSWSLDVQKLTERNPPGGFEYGFKPTTVCDSCLILADMDSFILVQNQETGEVYGIDLAQNNKQTRLADNAEQLMLIAVSVAELNPKDGQAIVLQQVRDILNHFHTTADEEFWKAIGMNWL